MPQVWTRHVTQKKECDTEEGVCHRRRVETCWKAALCCGTCCSCTLEPSSCSRSGLICSPTAASCNHLVCQFLRNTLRVAFTRVAGGCSEGPAPTTPLLNHFKKGLVPKQERITGCLELQVSFHGKSTHYRAFL